MSLILDTHALPWFLKQSRKLSAAVREAMESTPDPWLLSAISVAEAHGVVRKGKSAVTEAELFSFIESSGELRVNSVDYPIIRSALELDSLDGIHDKIIVATTKLLLRDDRDLRLVTTDRLIRASNLVPTLW